MQISPVIILFIGILITFILLAYFFSPKSDTSDISPKKIFPIQSLSTLPVNTLNVPRFTLSFFINPFQKIQTRKEVNYNFLPIVQYSGAWSIDFSGMLNASNLNTSYVQFTTRHGPTPTITSVPLPPISNQKWTHVAIVRDSRRITIYYNAKVVYSDILPSLLNNGAILQFGTNDSNNIISGNFTNVNVSTTVKSIEELRALMNALSDTNGLPYNASTYSFPLLSDIFSLSYFPKIPTVSLSPSVPPPGTKWNTQYS